MYQHYLGVDLHRRRSYVVLMDAKGKISDRRRLPNDAMPDYVAQLPKNTFAVPEATTNWSYMYDVLEEGAEKAVLAHPKRVKVIASARIKRIRLTPPPWHTWPGQICCRRRTSRRLKSASCAIWCATAPS